MPTWHIRVLHVCVDVMRLLLPLFLPAITDAYCLTFQDNLCQDFLTGGRRIMCRLHQVLSEVLRTPMLWCNFATLVSLYVEYSFRHAKCCRMVFPFFYYTVITVRHFFQFCMIRTQGPNKTTNLFPNLKKKVISCKMCRVMKNLVTRGHIMIMFLIIHAPDEGGLIPSKL